MDEVLELHASKFNVVRPNYREIILNERNSDREPLTGGHSLYGAIRVGTSTLITHVHVYDRYYDH